MAVSESTQKNQQLDACLDRGLLTAVREIYCQFQVKKQQTKNITSISYKSSTLVFSGSEEAQFSR